MNKIMPCIWFDHQGEEAMNYYLSIFKDSKIKSLKRYGDTGPGHPGSLLIATFEIHGFTMSILNGGGAAPPSPAISFCVNCADQAEIDYFWDKLGAGGKFMQCGWLTDKFGVSWQIVPEIMEELMNSDDKARSGRAMKAMMKMIKLDIQVLKDAADGTS